MRRYFLENVVNCNHVAIEVTSFALGPTLIIIAGSRRPLYVRTFFVIESRQSFCMTYLMRANIQQATAVDDAVIVARSGDAPMFDGERRGEY